MPDTSKVLQAIDSAIAILKEEPKQEKRIAWFEGIKKKIQATETKGAK